MVEFYLLYFLLGGAALLLLAWLWFVVRGFGTHFLWGLVVLLIPPAALAFLLAHTRKAIGPTLLALAGVLVAATPYVLPRFGVGAIDRGEREREVEDEPHLTLTRWDKKDYSFLRDRPRTVVLQMANADVTDETLKYIEGMKELRELDLNDTAVSDEGLVILAGLPKLEKLRLRKTKVTDEGFRKHLLHKESLVELDLTGTDVKSKTVREWKGLRRDVERKALK